MKIGRAIMAGLFGGLAMTILAWLVRLMELDFNPEMMFGTMVSSPGAVAWLIGLMMHLVVSALIALAYAWGFEHVVHRAGIWVGLGFAIIHLVIAGMFMGIIPALHPMIPEQMPAPGAFMANMGATFIGLFLLEHLLYGAIVGGTYGAVLHGRPLPSVAT
jgi:hypothetical protein